MMMFLFQAKESEMQGKLTEKDKYYETWLETIVANRLKDSQAQMEERLQFKEEQLVAIRKELEDQRKVVQGFALSRESRDSEHSRQIERLETEIKNLSRT